MLWLSRVRTLWTELLKLEDVEPQVEGGDVGKVRGSDNSVYGFVIMRQNVGKVEYGAGGKTKAKWRYWTYKKGFSIAKLLINCSVSLLLIGPKRLQVSPLTVTPVTVTFCLQWHFLGPKKDLLTLKIRVTVTFRLQWHFLAVPTLSL